MKIVKVSQLQHSWTITDIRFYSAVRKTESQLGSNRRKICKTVRSVSRGFQNQTEIGKMPFALNYFFYL